MIYTIPSQVTVGDDCHLGSSSSFLPHCHLPSFLLSGIASSSSPSSPPSWSQTPQLPPSFYEVHHHYHHIHHHHHHHHHHTKLLAKSTMSIINSNNLDQKSYGAPGELLVDISFKVTATALQAMLWGKTRKSNLQKGSGWIYNHQSSTQLKILNMSTDLILSWAEEQVSISANLSPYIWIYGATLAFGAGTKLKLLRYDWRNLIIYKCLWRWLIDSL